MIVRKFISDSHFLPAYVVLWALFIWSDGFVFFNDAKFKVIENPAPFYYFINLLFKGTYLINVIVAFLIVVVQAFMLNNLFASKNLIERNSYLPALFYITFMGFSFEMFGVTPALFANFFLIIALDKILDVFNEEKVFLEVFNSGLLIGIASMFYFPVFILFLFLIIALAVYFLINLRGVLSSFLGFITPAFFIAVYYYLFDKIEDQADTYFSNIHLFAVFKQDYSPFFYWFWIYVFFFGLIAFYRVFVRYVAGKPVRIRKRFNVLVYFVLIASVSYIFIQDFFIEHFAIMVIALSPVFAVYFQEIRRKFWRESIFSLLIIIILLGKLSRLGYIHFL